MIYWLCYDISDNRIRRGVRKFSKQVGLCTVQRSVMAGMLSESSRNHLWSFIKETIDPITDSCVLFRMGEQQFEALLSHGLPMPKEQIQPKEIALFF